MKFSELNKEQQNSFCKFYRASQLDSGRFLSPPGFPLASKENTEGSLSGGIHHITDKLSEGAETGC